jgi:hypothetical protein
MEPPPVLIKRVFAGVALAMVAALGACRRAADAPAENSAPPPATAPAQEPEAVSPPKSRASTPAPTAAESERTSQGDVQPGSDVSTAWKEPEGPAKTKTSHVEDQLPQATEELGQLPPAARDEASADDQAEEAPQRRVPLVDDPKRLQPLDPKDPVWIDPVTRQVVMLGEICQRRAPLELFACLRGSKEHESVVVVDVKAYVVHAGLLVAGATEGSPVQFDPQFVPPRGTEIEVTVVWEEEQGRRRQVRGQDWVHDVAETYATFDGVVPNEFDEEASAGDHWGAWKAMELPWVFAGSQFLKDEATGKRDYYADLDGCLICVSNFPSAVLDVPVRSTDSNAALWFDAFTERIPPLGTPVTLILTPKLEGSAGSAPPKRQ